MVSFVPLSNGSPRITSAAPVVRTIFTPFEVFLTIRARPEHTILAPENTLKGMSVLGNDQVMLADFVARVNFLTYFAIPSSATAGTELVPLHSLHTTGRTIPSLCFQTPVERRTMERIAVVAIPMMRTPAHHTLIRAAAFPTEPSVAAGGAVFVMSVLRVA